MQLSTGTVHCCNGGSRTTARAVIGMGTFELCILGASHGICVAFPVEEEIQRCPMLLPE